MSKETALQIAMRITHRYANSLFDEHTARGRQFMQEMSECLELEREQIENAWHAGVSDSDDAKTYYNIHCRATSEKYYNKTYKGGNNE